MDILIPIFTFDLSRKIVFWNSIFYFDIRSESEYAILIIEILFSHSNWVGKSNFDIQYSILTFWKCYFDIQNPILTFELSRKIVFCDSKSDFDIRTESGNAILTFEILFWHSNWVWKCYFDIRTESVNRFLTFKILFRHSHSVGKSYFYIQNPILTFEMSREMLFWYSKSYFDIRTESENAILLIKI